MAGGLRADVWQDACMRKESHLVNMVMGEEAERKLDSMKFALN